MLCKLFNGHSIELLTSDYDQNLTTYGKIHHDTKYKYKIQWPHIQCVHQDFSLKNRTWSSLKCHSFIMLP